MILEISLILYKYEITKVPNPNSHPLSYKLVVSISLLTLFLNLVFYYYFERILHLLRSFGVKESWIIEKSYYSFVSPSEFEKRSCFYFIHLLHFWSFNRYSWVAYQVEKDLIWEAWDYSLHVCVCARAWENVYAW